MEYNFDFDVWGQIFGMPKVIDKYLKHSTECDIKVLLCVLNNLNKNISCSEISQKINFPVEKVKESVLMWQKEKIIPKNIVLADTLEIQKPVYKNEEKKSGYKYTKPDSNYIANRAKNSESISWLMQEAELILGRPLSGGDSAMLLMLHDNDGLPVDVIVMLLQYAVGIGKSGIKYIYKIGESWAKEGIDDLIKAEKKIQSLNLIETTWRKFENLIGLDHRSPTAKEQDAIMRWFDEFKFSEDLVKEAYDRCVNANGKYILNYMDTIIKRWHSEGIYTIEQALMENSKRNKYKKYDSKNEPTSYNIDEYENYSVLENYIKR